MAEELLDVLQMNVEVSVCPSVGIDFDYLGTFILWSWLGLPKLDHDIKPRSSRNFGGRPLGRFGKVKQNGEADVDVRTLSVEAQKPQQESRTYVLAQGEAQLP